MKFTRLQTLASTLLASLLLVGCASKTYYVDQDTGKATKQETVSGLNYRDFANAASEMVDSMLKNPRLRHPQADQGAVYVLAVSSVINDTSQRIDTDQLTKKIRIDLLNSGQFMTTTAIGLSSAEDELIKKARELKHSKMVNQGTVKGNNTVIAPDFSLSGKLIQNTFTLDSRTSEVNYYLQMTLTDINTGLAYWEAEVPIVKHGDSRSVSW